MERERGKGSRKGKGRRRGRGDGRERERRGEGRKERGRDLPDQCQTASYVPEATEKWAGQTNSQFSEMSGANHDFKGEEFASGASENILHTRVDGP